VETKWEWSQASLSPWGWGEAAVAKCDAKHQCAHIWSNLWFTAINLRSHEA
jgi:hypothetical protein